MMMQNTAIVPAILSAFAIFFIVVAVATIQYNKLNKKSVYGKKHPDEWLFKDINQKIYKAFWNRTDPSEIASKFGIKTKQYLQNCSLVKTEPELEKLIMYHIYGIAFLILGGILFLTGNTYYSLGCLVAFFLLFFFEQISLNQKVNKMKIEIENDLPRMLDLLKTELDIGLPIETAIYILCNKVDSLLSREILESINESEMSLNDWQKALENVATKYDVELLNSFVLDISTAYRKGVSVAETVSRKADEIHKTHLLKLKERAGKSTNTILIPIAIFQFVPLLFFLLFPTIYQTMFNL